MLEATTSVTYKPTKAQAYCVDRLPRLSTNPPAIANKTKGQLSYIKHQNYESVVIDTKDKGKIKREQKNG